MLLHKSTREVICNFKGEEESLHDYTFEEAHTIILFAYVFYVLYFLDLNVNIDLALYRKLSTILTSHDLMSFLLLTVSYNCIHFHDILFQITSCSYSFKKKPEGKKYEFDFSQHMKNAVKLGAKEVDTLHPEYQLSLHYPNEVPKGRIAHKLPFKVLLEKDQRYSWCTCGSSNSQVSSFIMSLFLQNGDTLF